MKKTVILLSLLTLFFVQTQYGYARVVKYITDYTAYVSREDSGWERLLENQNGITAVEEVKFNRDKEDAQPFHGITTIARVDEDSDLYGRLSEVLDEIKSSDFGHKIHFVDPISFHITLCDIELGLDDVGKESSGKNPVTQEREGELIKQFEATKEDLSSIEQIKTVIRGIGTFPGAGSKILFFRVYPQEGDHDGLNRLLRINNILKGNIDGNNIPNRDLTGHITLGYIVDPFTAEEYKEFTKLLSKYNEILGELDIDHIELNRFPTMDEYIEIDRVSLQPSS